MDNEEILAARQFATLEALVDSLIPPDDWAGGVDAGVVDYLLRQFRGDLAAILPIYRRALDLLDAEAPAAFLDLEPNERVELLGRLERGESTEEWPFSAAWFLSMAATHAAEGFYSDPGNGGNRDGVGWRMIGFEVRG